MACLRIVDRRGLVHMPSVPQCEALALLNVAAGRFGFGGARGRRNDDIVARDVHRNNGVRRDG